MRTTRRHRLAVKKALDAGELTLTPGEPGKRYIESVDAEIARLCALTDTRRGVWRQALSQRVAALPGHVTREAERVIEAVTDRVDATSRPAAQFFEAVGGAGSSADLRAQAAALRARATEVAKEERKKAKSCRESSESTHVIKTMASW